MLVKRAFIQLQPVPLSKVSSREKKVVPMNSHDYRYLRFRAIGNLEVSRPEGGFNGNWDGFPYKWFVDPEPGYGYKSFVGKRAHYEHNSSLGKKGSIGDLPDAYLNKFIYPEEVEGKSWYDLDGSKFASLRESILQLPGQKDGAIEVLMRIDTTLLSKKGMIESKTKQGLDRVIKMIDSGQKIYCSMGCFLPGTQVLLPTGVYTYIENIRNGEEIVSHKGIPRQVTDTQVRNYEGNILKISVTGLQRSLHITPEHPILVKKRGGYCACGCGTRVNSKYSETMWVSGHSQYIFNSNPNVKRDKEKDEIQKEELKKKFLEQLEWVEARDVEEKDYVAYPISQEETEVTHITEGKARLIGYFLAEGSYLKYTNKQEDTYKTGVAFSFGGTEKDKSFVEETQLLLQKEFGVNTNTYNTVDYVDKDEAKERWGTTLNYGATEVRACSREVAQFFNFYCGEYACSKKLPIEVMNWPKELQKHLISAYFNGDGGQSFQGNCSTISAVTISEELAYQVLYILKRLGIPSSLERSHYEYQLNPFYTVYIRGIWQNILHGYWSYEKTKSEMHDKGKTNSQFKLTDNFILLPIRKIEYQEYKGPVYNLEVEGEHSYIANGIAVHNCNVEYSICSACGNKAKFASDYCDHLTRGRKGALTISTANQMRDMLDKDLMRPEWLKHVVASHYDIQEILKGSSNKGVAVRNGEINHKLAFFELSVVGTPAFEIADALEKIANLSNDEYKEFLKQERARLGDNTLVDLYSLLQEDGIISSGCQVEW